MPEGHPSEAVENFLKAVYALVQGGDRAATNDLRDTLAISAPSVTDMAQRLVTAGFIDYQKYHGVALTPAGLEIALRVIRRHRLIEAYLVKELDYPLLDVHAEAERLEHAVSDHFVEAIARKLGDPAFDPHGDPIPQADLSLHERALCPLTDVAENTPAQVRRLKSDDPAMLQHLLERGFRLDARVLVAARDPFEGPLTLDVDGVRRVIGYQAAACVFVETAPP